MAKLHHGPSFIYKYTYSVNNWVSQRRLSAMGIENAFQTERSRLVLIVHFSRWL